MRCIYLTLVLLCLVWRSPVLAQPVTADAYFNQASKEYVKEDKIQALRTLDQALQRYPGDPKLLKLAEELVKEEEQQQKDQQKKDQQEQEKEKQDQKEKEKEQKDQDQDQEQKEKEQKDQEQKQQEEQKQKEQEQQQQNAENGEPKDEKGTPKTGTIAPQDALRILDALERSEKDVQDKVRLKKRPASRRTIEKDW